MTSRRPLVLIDGRILELPQGDRTPDSELLGGKPGSFYLAYENLTGVPAAFTPTLHAHVIGDVTGLQDALNAKATTLYVDTKVADLVASSPGTLDTLNELAAALGDDPNFATTVSNQIGQKLDASAYTAADILAKIKTVDGSGSGLIADMVDGLHATQFVRSDADDTVTGLVTIDRTGKALQIGSEAGVAGADAHIYFGVSSYGWKMNYHGVTSGDDGNEFQLISSSTGKGYEIDHLGNWVYLDGAGGKHKVWHAGIGGAGSDLDAGKLGGLLPTQFVRYQAGATVSGLHNSLADAAWVANNGGASNIDHIHHDDATNTWHFVSDGSFKQDGNATIRANELELVGTSTALTRGTGNSLRVVTNSGYAEFGPQNSGWNHLITDRPGHYFNTKVAVNGDLIAYNGGTQTKISDNDGNLSTAGQLVDERFARKFEFEPGTPGSGNRVWVRLCSVDGDTTSVGGSIEFILSGLGDYGDYDRASMHVMAGERSGTFNVDAFALNMEDVNQADLPEIHAVATADPNTFEIWAKLADWNQTHTLTLLNSAGGSVHLDNIGTTAPTGSTLVTVKEVYTSANPYIAKKNSSLDQFADSTDGSNTISTHGRDFRINGKRAMVGFGTADSDKLYINYSGDFANGVVVNSPMSILGEISTTGNIDLNDGDLVLRRTVAIDPVNTPDAKTYSVVENQQANTNLAFRMKGDDSTDRMSFMTAYSGAGGYSEWLSILAQSGNVGVKSSAPVYDLDVTGDARATGAVRANTKVVTPRVEIGNAALAVSGDSNSIHVVAPYALLPQNNGAPDANAYLGVDSYRWKGVFAKYGNFSGNFDVAGNLVVGGNLTVNGTVTQVNTTEVNIGDNIIVLNADETGVPSQDAGIEIERGTGSNAKFIWDETADAWNFVGHYVQGIGGLTVNGVSSFGGDMTIDSGDTTFVNIVSNDNGKSQLNVMGDAQGTGRVFVGQSGSYGGGIEYNGDNAPATTGAGSDFVTLWRRNGGSDEWTARNAVTSNVWEFRDRPNVLGDDIVVASDLGAYNKVDTEQLNQYGQESTGSGFWAKVAEWDLNAAYSHFHGHFVLSNRFSVTKVYIETSVGNPATAGFTFSMVYGNKTNVTDIRLLQDNSGSTTKVELWAWCQAWSGGCFASLEQVRFHTMTDNLVWATSNEATSPSAPVGVSATYAPSYKHYANEYYENGTPLGQKYASLSATNTFTGVNHFSGGNLHFNTAGQQLRLEKDTVARDSLAWYNDGTPAWSIVHDNSDHLDFVRKVGSGDVKINGNRILTTADTGSGNGFDADTVDGLQGANIARKDARTDGYMWLRRNSVNSAMFITNQSTGNIIEYHQGAGDGTFTGSKVANDGTLWEKGSKLEDKYFQQAFVGSTGGTAKWVKLCTTSGSISERATIFITAGGTNGYAANSDQTSGTGMLSLTIGNNAVADNLNGSYVHHSLDTEAAISEIKTVENSGTSHEVWAYVKTYSDINIAWFGDITVVPTPGVQQDADPGGYTKPIYKSWHSGNDGAGTGLDADKLHGLSPDQFLRSDVSGSIDGFLKVGTSNTVSDGTDQLIVEQGIYANSSVAGGPKYIGFAEDGDWIARFKQDSTGPGGSVKIVDLEFNGPQSAFRFNGNTVLTSASSVNTLDDCEEGTWTPTLLFGGVDATTNGATLSTSVANYTKVGRQVTVNIRMVLSAKGTGTGRVEIGNLPFAVANELANTDLQATANVGYYAGFATSVYGIGASADDSVNRIRMRRKGAANGALSLDLTNSDCSDSSSLALTLTYFTN